MSLVTTLVLFLVFRNSKVWRATPLSFFCSWIRLAAVVNTMGVDGPISLELLPLLR
jgi:hypothetical protein